MEKMDLRVQADVFSQPDYPIFLGSDVGSRVCTTILKPSGVQAHEHIDMPVPDDYFTLYLKISGITEGVAVQKDSEVFGQHLVLTSVRVNDIEILPVFMNNAWYYPDNRWYDEQSEKDPDKFPWPCRMTEHIGWNGKFELKMRAPVYSWLLENL